VHSDHGRKTMPEAPGPVPDRGSRSPPLFKESRNAAWHCLARFVALLLPHTRNAMVEWRYFTLRWKENGDVRYSF
jgi:hypothetical protein